MFENLARNWWAFLLRGVVAVLFGVFLLARPGLGLATLIAMYGTFAILGGLSAIYTAGMAISRKEAWGMYLVEGILWVAAGVVAFAYPALTSLALLLLIAAWAFVIGVFNIAMAISLRKAMAHEWALGLAGAVSIAFSLLLFMRPGAGALSVLGLIAGFAIIYGFLTLILAFEIHSVATGIRRRLEV